MPVLFLLRNSKNIISPDMSDKSIYYLSVLKENFNFRLYLRIRDNLCQYALCSQGLLRQRFDLFTVMMISDKRNSSYGKSGSIDAPRRSRDLTSLVVQSSSGGTSGGAYSDELDINRSI